MTQPLCHHKFRPWRVAKEQRIVAAEAAWKKPSRWNARAACCCRKESCDYEHEAGCPQRERPRVLVDVDVFENWGGDVRDSHGGVAYYVNGRFASLKPGQFFLADRHTATLDDVRSRLFGLIDATPNLTWLVTTKQPKNIRRMVPIAANGRDPSDPQYMHRNNLWLGVLITCQDDADRMIPELLKCRELCAKTFVNIEPLIGPIDLTRYLNGVCFDHDADFGGAGDCKGHPVSSDWLAFPGWLIVGGDIGPNARPCNVAWIRSIVRQCRAAGVPVFVKQVGSHVIDRNDAGFTAEWDDGIGWSESVEVEEHIDGYLTDYQGAPVRVRTRDTKGGDPAEWPKDLRVREVPT